MASTKFSFVGLLYDAGWQRSFEECVNNGNYGQAVDLLKKIPNATEPTDKLNRLVILSAAQGALIDRGGVMGVSDRQELEGYRKVGKFEEVERLFNEGEEKTFVTLVNKMSRLDEYQAIDPDPKSLAKKLEIAKELETRLDSL